MKPIVWPLVVMVGALAASQGSAAPATREDLKRQREAIEAEHARRAEACRQQFVVTPCLDKVRADMQQALSSVRDQESALDAAERQGKRQARERRLADKAGKAAIAASATAPSATRSGQAASAARQPPVPRAAKPRKTPAAEDRSAQEQQRRAEYESRQREIKAHREEVEKRNAERARRKPPQPLPPPASGAS